MNRFAFIFILATFLSFQVRGSAVFLKKISEFAILTEKGEPTLKAYVETVDGNKKEVHFRMVDDKFEEKMIYEANNPFAAGKYQLCFYDEIRANLVEESRNMWIRPELIQFNLRILRSSSQNDDIRAYLEVLFKEKVVAKGFISQGAQLQVDPNVKIDGDYNLASVSIKNNRFNSIRREFDMDFEVTKGIQIQRFKMSLNLSDLRLTSRMEKLNLNSDEMSTLNNKSMEGEP